MQILIFTSLCQHTKLVLHSFKYNYVLWTRASEGFMAKGKTRGNLAEIAILSTILAHRLCVLCCASLKIFEVPNFTWVKWVPYQIACMIQSTSCYIVHWPPKIWDHSMMDWPTVRWLNMPKVYKCQACAWNKLQLHHILNYNTYLTVQMQKH